MLNSFEQRGHHPKAKGHWSSGSSGEEGPGRTGVPGGRGKADENRPGRARRWKERGLRAEAARLTEGKTHGSSHINHKFKYKIITNFKRLNSMKPQAWPL